MDLMSGWDLPTYGSADSALESAGGDLGGWSWDSFATGTQGPVASAGDYDSEGFMVSVSNIRDAVAPIFDTLLDFEQFQLQRDLIDAQGRQYALMNTTSLDNNTGAIPASPGVVRTSATNGGGNQQNMLLLGMVALAAYMVLS